jgi:tetratricopeptide (TPR) repeat protein
MEFQRFTAPDTATLAKSIEETRLKLEHSSTTGDSLGTIEHAADLASMLTTARREIDALNLIEKHLSVAEALPVTEPIGWFWNAYATALQYSGQRARADAVFSRALNLCRASGWSRLESFVLQHWGRSLAEQGQLDEAEACFSEALSIRTELNDPRQESSRRALDALVQLRGQSS